MSKVYVVAAKRSAIGSFLGSLSNISPAEFGAQVLKQMIKDVNIDKNLIDEVIIGNVLSAGHKQGLARQISVLAGISEQVPAYSLNMVCGSGMKAVINAYTSIKAGMADLIVAGGIEAMSQAPFLVKGDIRKGHKMGNMELVDYMLEDALTDAFENYHMGITAENIVDKYNLTKDEQDKFAFESQLRARKAQQKGLFKDEIVPIAIKTKKGDIVFNEDEYINKTTTLEKIYNLKPVFKKDGTVTAASSSGINDGASFLIIASEQFIKKHKLTPLLEVVGIGQGGVDHKVMGLGPIPAIEKSLKHANLKLSDIDVLELNEAFAAQSIGVINQLALKHKIDKDELMAKTNISGGAIALGHPIGASGNRIIVTLVHHMLRNKNFNLGLASLCIGGGMGTSVILKQI